MAKTLKNCILIIDPEDHTRQTVAQYLQNLGYQCQAYNNLEQALEALSNNSVDLVISNLNGSGKDGQYLLRKISRVSPDVAVIVTTAFNDTRLAVECLKQGAYDYLIKPFDLEQVQIAVKRALERKRLLAERKAYERQLEIQVRKRTLELIRAREHIERVYQRILEVIVSTLELREQSTGGHSRRVVEYTKLIAREMRIPADQLIHMARGAILHDVGKIGIPDRILLKKSHLTSQEWQLMREHTIKGYEILKEIDFLKPALDIVLYHHERYDGTGYPHGLKGEQIPVGARIFAVADAFDAITSPRAYHKARSVRWAKREILRHAGTQFDPKVVQAFLRIPDEKLERIRKLAD